MRPFDEIIGLAVGRHGGSDAFERMLAETRPSPLHVIAAIPDDRILATMTRRVFYAGFSSKVIDSKWEAFESAFEHFDPARCAWMTEERLDELLKRPDIVKNGAKIKSVLENGRFVMELAAKHGAAARFFAEWPDKDYVGLLEFLKKNASRLGGETGMRFLRSIGKPAFIPTPDVVRALIREEVLSKSPSGRGDLLKIQAAFNQWSDQSGLDLTSISRTLAMSVG
ncbi:DNA-3-methyladenine glycosylase I [Roseiarcus fermentans]|uniref:DNA-3-methyladenine glycosylase I n=1 Tax=Roseiarcus fermentans TaxID=1473586 RepID=A0A366EJ61_9HYPH|nr:DNA-3-methyladenine glycosylase I [Roseiarcus fermentans]RBP02413.1 DNA-3-methyladenine glycosylase I [Roseiarcus fermentans]